ncbi:AAA family ATPase [Streptomyces sp. NPDC087903]|uniref:AAA family ATPase n=1 Tax=Streptomyces sp. NPDC087903 TaxID=3365819 RepID=UPI0037F3A575
MVTDVVLAVLVGLQASGKSTFYARCLSTRYALVSKDLFPRGARNRQRRQMRLVVEHLVAGTPVAVDNTNPSADEWSPLVEVAHEYAVTDGRDGTATAWFPSARPRSAAMIGVLRVICRYPGGGRGRGRWRW